MSHLISIIAALSALTPSAFAAPQSGPVPGVPNPANPDPVCPVPIEDYEVTEVSDPYFTKAEPVGGASCPQGDGGSCEHQKGYEHSVGVTQSLSGGISGGLDIKKIFNIGASFGYEYSWSTEDATAVSAYAACPDPEKGTYICGMQVRPKKIKTKGQVHRYYPEGCANAEDPGWVDFEVEAPAMSKGGPNEDSNVLSTFEPCILSCPDDPNSLDCDGVRSARNAEVPLCPETKSKNYFEPGWCTAHIIQHQRWQGVVGDKFKFSLTIYDGEENEIYNELYQEVNDDGVLSVNSLLPENLDIKTGADDNDYVEICYNGECFTCDENDGGGHACTLGNGKENGYEDNKRQGDFGFTC